MLLPYGTDAPLHHQPFATLSIIVANVLVFLAMINGQLDPEPWILSYGQGLHPLQWITSAFIHGGWAHLIGNMVFLWVFGWVIEGRVGAARFAAIYFGLSFVQCGIEQLLTQGVLAIPGVHEPGSYGASAVIFGLIAMALVFNPKNEVSVFYWLFLFIGTFRVSILVAASFYLLLDLFSLTLSGFALSTPMLHLSGAVLGLALGALMVKQDMVDCEGWDIFSVASGAPDRHRRQLASPMTAREVARLERDLDATLTRRRRQAARRVCRALENDDLDGAMAAFRIGTAEHGAVELSEADHRRLIRALADASRHAESRPVLEAFIGRFGERAHAMRVHLAHILLSIEQRPRRALRVLQGVKPLTLSDPVRARYRRLLAEARERVARGSGRLELVDEGI